MKKLYYNEMDGFFNGIKRVSRYKKMAVPKYLIRRILNNIFGLMANVSPLGTLRKYFHRLRGVTIGENVFFGSDIVIDKMFPEEVIIRDNVALSPGVRIFAHSIPPKHFKRIVLPHVSTVVLDEGCWIGAYSIILPGCRIGKNSIVSAGSVVTQDVPDYSIVQGNPAVIVHKIDNSSIVENGRK